MTDFDPNDPMNTQDRLTFFESEGLAPRWFAILFGASIVGLVYTLSAFIPDVVLAAILVAAFAKPFEWLTTKFGGRKWLASSVITGLIVVVVVVPISALTVTMVDEAADAYEATTTALEADGLPSDAIEADVQLEGSGPRTPVLLEVALGRAEFGDVREELIDDAEQYALSASQTILEYAREALNDFFAAFLHFMVVLVLVFYFLVESRKVKDFVFRLSPLPEEEEEMLSRTFADVSYGILFGNGVGSVIQGVVGGVAMALVGFESPVLWGSIMTVFAFLPLVGVSVVVVPATLYLWFTGSEVLAVGFFVFCSVMALFVENVVKTKLIGAKVHMNDILVFLSILGGIASFGLLGLLYGPLIVTAFLSLSELYEKKYRHTYAKSFVKRELKGLSR